MRDRIPTYPGRVKLEPVAGQANVYDLTRADEPTEAGTPINKASLLTDAVAAAFGLGTSAVPNDVLDILKKGVLAQATEKYTKHTTLEGFPENGVIQLNEAGSPVEFYVAKQGYEPDLNGPGRVLLVRKDCYDTRVWNTQNINTYATSAMDSWLNGDYKSLLDGNVRSAMGTTKFKYTPGNGNTTVSTLERAIFTLSATELGVSAPYGNTEGTALPVASTLKIATLDGVIAFQWTRTISTANTNGAYSVTTGGGPNMDSCVTARGSRPAFTLPQEFAYTWYTDENGNVYTEQEYQTILTDVLGNEITAGARVEVGSYVGTGTVGSGGQNKLSFSFSPKFVFVIQSEGGYWAAFIGGCAHGAAMKFNTPGLAFADQITTWGSKSMSWYVYGAYTTSGSYDISGGAIYQLNLSGKKYDYVAIG